MDFKNMTNDELITIQNVIQMELEERENANKKKAISNFENAFNELNKYIYEISVEDNEYEITIDNFNQFHFED